MKIKVDKTGFLCYYSNMIKNTGKTKNAANENLQGKPVAFYGKWRVHTPGLLREIGNFNSLALLHVPLTVFGRLLHAVGRRAAEINDPELNRLMIRLTMYEEADPESPHYRRDLCEKLLKENPGGKIMDSKAICFVCRGIIEDSQSAILKGETVCKKCHAVYLEHQDQFDTRTGGRYVDGDRITLTLNPNGKWETKNEK